MNRTPDAAADGFLSRWSRRKTLVRQGATVPEPPPAAAVTTPPPVAVGPGAVRAGAASSAGDALPAQAGQPAATPATPPASTPASTPAPAPADPLPTLEEARALAPGADVRRFVAPGVQPDVRNAALKQLFADPHFNVMDGLDTYIDDYGRPDPLPPGMLRQMAQSAALGLFRDDEEDDAARAAARADPSPDAALRAAPDPAASAATEATPEPDEDPDLRLQPHDAAGPGRTAPGAEPHPGRQR